MKLWDLVKAANSNLFRNKLRTILTIVAIFIGGLVITLMVSVNAGVNDYIHQQIGGIGGKDTLLITVKQDRGSNSSGPQKFDPNANTTSVAGSEYKALSDNDITKIKTTTNIKSVSPQYLVSALYIANGSAQYKISTNQLVDGITVQTNHGVAPSNDTNELQMSLLPDYGKALGFGSDAKAVGQTVQLAAKTPVGLVKTINVKIVGVQQNSLLNSSGGAWINDAVAKALNDILTTGVPASVKNQYLAAVATMQPGLSDQQITDLKDHLSQKGFAARTVADEIGAVQTVVDAITISLIGFGAVALIAASFGIINTLFMSVQERTKEIGLMKAMGMSRRKVFAMFSIEAILIGFWGSLIGVVAAFGVGKLINRIATQTFLKNLPGFTLCKFQIASMLVVMLIIMLIAFLAGTLPARRASKKDPIEALRYE
ncbi:ABC transporter permease [Candidatus Saccharibacteria bacterium]|nr:ABC transporter permease [Candidatus Saccharibacteria bacterium]